MSESESGSCSALAPSSRKSRRKTNSERGKEFRAKKKEHETLLLELITSLRAEVRDLQLLRDIRGETALVSRASPDGSLARLVREYFSLFSRGRPTRLHVGGKRESPSAASSLITKQDDFLRHAMDEMMAFGGAVGVAALLDQWERYTLYHSSFRISVVSLEVSGPEDSPIVTVTSHLSVKLSRETFKHIFPHVADDESLVSRLVGKEVTYRGVNQFEFGASDHQIKVYESDVDFVNAFLSAGVSLADVAALMQRALISEQHLLGEEPTPECKSPLEIFEEIVSCSDASDVEFYFSNQSSNNTTEEVESCSDGSDTEPLLAERPCTIEMSGTSTEELGNCSDGSDTEPQPMKRPGTIEFLLN